MTYAGRINKADGLIDWSQPAIAIERQIRAYNPWPAAHTLYRGAPLRCLQASVTPATAPAGSEPGVIFAHDKAGLYVQTADGVLELNKVQLAGKKPVAAADFANAHATDDIVLGK